MLGTSTDGAWRRAAPWRPALLLGVLLFGTLASIMLSREARALERARLELQFHNAAANHVAAVESVVSSQLLILEAMRSWYAASAERRSEDLDALARPLLENLPGVRALEWVPRVAAGARSAHEAAMRSAGAAGYEIRERAPDGALVTAGSRPEYFPVSDVRPGEEADPVLGFDLASEPTRRAAMERAWDSGRAAATSRVRLVQEEGTQSGFLVFAPVYAGRLPPAEPSVRRAALRGFVVGVYRVSDLVEGGLAPLSAVGVDLVVLDEDGPDADAVLYQTAPSAHDPVARPPDAQPTHEGSIEVAGRTWLVRSRLAHAPHVPPWYPLVLLMAGLTITGLAASFLVVVDRRNRVLSLANQLLQAEMAERARAEAAVRTSETRYRSLFDGGPDGVLVIRDFRFVQGNRRVAEMFGCTIEELVGRHPGDFSPPTQPDGRSSPEKAQELLEAAYSGERQRFEWRHQRLDGSVFDAEITLNQVELDDGIGAQGIVRDITEQKRAEARVASLYRSVHVGIGLSVDRVIIEANDALCLLLGYPRKEMVGRPDRFLYPDDDTARFVWAQAERIHLEGFAAEEVVLQRSDGRLVDVLMTGTPLEPGARESGIVFTVLDVTERNRARRNLEESERRYRELIEHTDNLVVQVDGEGRVGYVNEAVARRLGGPASACLGERAIDHLHASERKAAGELAALWISQRRENVSYEGRLQGELEVYEVLWGITLQYDAAGALLWVNLIGRDVTEQKRAERELLDSRRLLAEAQRVAGLGSLDCDVRAGGLLRLSEGFAALCDLPDPGEGGGPRRFEDLLALLPPDGRACLEALQRDVLERRRGAVGAYRAVRDDGSVRYLSTHAEPILDDRGVARIVVTVQDDTDRKQAERESERHRQELMQADKMIALGTLLSGVAHEINNPNHFILLNLPLLQAAWRDVLPILDAHAATDAGYRIANVPYAEMREEIPQILDEVVKGAERIKLIVSELRDYTRARPSEHRDVDVNDVVHSALTLLANPIRKATRRFSVHYARELPPVRGDLRRLEQVVINLILNACQALPDANRELSVTTSFDVETDMVEVSVRDAGCGIAPADLGRIRDPFFTTKREQGGTGLGLAVAARIVEEHAARLTYDSEVGHGTTARLAIPRLRDDDERP